MRKVEESSRRAHSLLVGRIMVILAGLLDGLREEWELVGILHDIDYDAVQGDMVKHGIIAAESLTGVVSEEGLDAIRSHDHRTGFKSSGPLADSLRFADAVAVLIEDQGLQGPVTEALFERALLEESTQKPWIEEIVVFYSKTYGVQISDILNEVGGL